MSVLHAVRKSGSAVLGIAVLAVILLLVAGCGSRQTIEGTVTLDGQPLEQGYINFRPMPKAKGPPVGGPIEKGKYALRAKEPMEGDFRVEITALGKTGKKTRAESGDLADVEVQILPARYNTESKLQVQLKPGQRNAFPFPLTAQ